MITYSPEEVAAAHLPAELKDPVRWLKRRLARGEIPGKRISRSVWRMTEADIEAWLMSRDSQRRIPQEEADLLVVSITDGLSRRSRSRVVAS